MDLEHIGSKCPRDDNIFSYVRWAAFAMNHTEMSWADLGDEIERLGRSAWLLKRMQESVQKVMTD